MQPQLIAGRYQVLRAIGRGGMGIVWLCRDDILGREVAVKQIGALPGESANETKRAMREARSAAALNHPNAVAVFDVVNHDERPWLVMEYVEGETLADEISRNGRLSPKRVADVGSQLAGALARAHERRIVHRDIKPGNVLVDKAGRPKISDFGIARGHGDDQLTQTGFVTGTPGYLSPELARGFDPDSASDIWALGATLYAAVEGQPPYEPRSNPIALLRAIATERPRPMTRAGVMGPAIEAMMHEDPSRRWDMATAAQRLGRIARVEATAVMRVDPVRPVVVVAPPVVPPIDSTQRLDSTQRSETVAPPIGSTQRLESTQRSETVAPPIGSTQRLESTQRSETVAPPTGSTRRLESTQRSETVAPTIGSTQRLESTQRSETVAPVVQTPVVKSPEVKAVVPAEPVIATPKTAEPVIATPKAAEPVVKTPVVKTPVVAAAAVRRPGPAGPRELEGEAPVQPPVGRTSDGASDGTSDGTRDGTRDGTSGPRRLLPVLVALLVVVFGVGFLLNQLGGQDKTPVTSNPTVAARTTAPEASKTPDPPVTTSSAPITTAAPDPNDDQRLARFVSSYYSDVTRSTDRTWGKLTPKMQNAAGGRKGYDGFWRTIRGVKINQARADASSKTAVVSLTYTSASGGRSTETHRFTFVTKGGEYLIDRQQNVR